MPKQTALYEYHVTHGGRMIDFHDWLMPVQYEGVLAEHKACREHAALFDTSHMGQITIFGESAAAALGEVTTQDPLKLPVGRGRYGFLLNEPGGILDDTILFRLDEQEFLLVVNADTADADLEWVKSHVGERAKVEALGPMMCKLDLQGPASGEILQKLVDVDLARLPYFGLASGQCCNRPAIISRSGYTGEYGFEIFISRGGVEIVWGDILSYGAKPGGLGARDLLRLEMCYPLYGQDINVETSPIEAGLGQFIDGGRAFVGADAIEQITAQGPRRKLVAFRSDSRKKAANGQEIRVGGQAVGMVTSAGFSPSVGVSIGMGYVDVQHAAVGTQLTIETDRGELPVVVAKKPLYTGGSVRRKG